MILYKKLSSLENGGENNSMDNTCFLCNGRGSILHIEEQKMADGTIKEFAIHDFCYICNGSGRFGFIKTL